MAGLHDVRAMMSKQALQPKLQGARTIPRCSQASAAPHMIRYFEALRLAIERGVFRRVPACPKRYKVRRPLMKLTRTMTMATTRRMWMKPPIV
jgi:hypothetical protein